MHEITNVTYRCKYGTRDLAGRFSIWEGRPRAAITPFEYTTGLHEVLEEESFLVGRRLS